MLCKLRVTFCFKLLVMLKKNSLDLMLFEEEVKSSRLIKLHLIFLHYLTWFSSTFIPHYKYPVWMWPLRVKFTCSPHVHVGSSQVLLLPPQSTDLQVGWTSSSESPAGVNVSVISCYSLCVSTEIDSSSVYSRLVYCRWLARSSSNSS